MIMHLLSDIGLTLQIVDVTLVDGGGSGLALGLVDDLAIVATSSSSGGATSTSSRSLVAVDSAARRCRPLDARDEVAHDLFGDVEAALQLRDGLGRGIEQDDVVRALAVGIRWGTRGGGGPTGSP